MMKKAASLFLAVLMLMSVFPLRAMAAEPTDFEPIDSPMIENQTDSSRLPVRESEFSDVYGQTDAASADRITSMFSDEAWERFAVDMDRALEFEPIADEEAAPVLTKVEQFVSSGGVAGFVNNGSLLQGMEIGLRNNRDDMVQVLGTDMNASAWVYVVDKDATCFVVQDENGEGIPNAEISAGEGASKSVTDAYGQVSFTADIRDLVTVRKDGYTTVTALVEALGESSTVTLQKDLFLAGASDLMPLPYTEMLKRYSVGTTIVIKGEELEHYSSTDLRNALTAIADVEAYDYTVGYPPKINFDTYFG